MKAIIVAEIGSNWEGSVNKAKKIIHECKKAGADAIKFQMWRAEDLYNTSNPNWKNIKKSELTFEQVKKIKGFADQIGIEFFCSVFYPEAVNFLETLKVKKYKIASRTCLLKDPYSLDTLVTKARTKKPMIINLSLIEYFIHSPCIIFLFTFYKCYLTIRKKAHQNLVFIKLYI